MLGVLTMKQRERERERKEGRKEGKKRKREGERDGRKEKGCIRNFCGGNGYIYYLDCAGDIMGVFIHKSELIEVYTLNVYTILYIKYTSIKLRR